MSININAIFSNGVVDTDLLKTVLQELASKMEVLESNQTVALEFNEKINLTSALSLITSGEFLGYYNIEVAHIIKTPASVVFFYDSVDANGNFRTDVLSQSFIKTVNGSNVVVNLPFEKTKLVNLYVIYEK